MNKIRKPAVAGLFYPSQPKKLNEELDLLLSVSQPVQMPSLITGIISPHAGYIYSGRTAAFAFNILKNKKIKNVIIISPSHHEYFEGISVYEGSAFETPLGIVEVNKEIALKLVKGSNFISLGTAGHKQEHAVEVQIPFLQKVLSDFKIVPIVMGDQRNIFVDELADQLAKVIDNETIILASSDLSHYYSKEEANRLDSIVEKRIRDFDFDRLQFDIENRFCEACGGGPIVAMMKAASLSGNNKSIVLNRSDSGDTSGDNSQVVGYLSAVIYGE
ncbi:MAG: AmmeMemoRadiSam system protein B [Ignavibacteriaceae bacterium]